VPRGGTRSRASGAFALVACAVAAAPARAEPERVALVDRSPVLREAIEAVLNPWGIRVVVLDVTPPGSSMPSAAQRAREIAVSGGTRATIWLTSEDGQHAVWVYDAETETVVARPVVVAPPLDDETAAAVALSVKSLLRHTEVVAVEERFGAAPAKRRDVRSSFQAFVGTRWRRTQASDLEPRLGIGAVWSHRFAPGCCGLFARVSAGPGITVDEPGFVGHFSDITAGVGVQAQLGLGSAVRLVPWTGASLHFTHLDGVVSANDNQADVRRINPFVDAGVLAQRLMARTIALGVRIDGGYALRRQNYLVGGAPVFELPAGELEITLQLDITLL
jgi:hypothetical protein